MENTEEFKSNPFAGIRDTIENAKNHENAEPTVTEPEVTEPENNLLYTATSVPDALDLNNLVDKLNWICDGSVYLSDAIESARKTIVDEVNGTLNTVFANKSFKASDQTGLVCDDEAFVELVDKLSSDGLVSEVKNIVTSAMNSHIVSNASLQGSVDAIIGGANVSVNKNIADTLAGMRKPEFYSRRINYDSVIRTACLNAVADVCGKMFPAINDGLRAARLSVDSASSLLGKFTEDIDVLKNRDDVASLDIGNAMQIIERVTDKEETIKKLQHMQDRLLKEQSGYMVDRETLRSLREQYADLQVMIDENRKINQPKSVLAGSLSSLSQAIEAARQTKQHATEYSMTSGNIKSQHMYNAYGSTARQNAVFNGFLDAEDGNRRMLWNTALDMYRKSKNPSLTPAEKQAINEKFKATITQLMTENNTEYQEKCDSLKKQLDSTSSTVQRDSINFELKEAALKRRLIERQFSKALTDEDGPSGVGSIGKKSASASFEDIGDKLSEIVTNAKAPESADEILDLYTAVFFHKKNPTVGVDTLLATVKKKKNRPDVTPDTTAVSPNKKLFKFDTRLDKYKFVDNDVTVPLHVAYEMSKGWVEFGKVDDSFVIRDNGVDKNNNEINIWSATLTPNDPDWSFSCCVNVVKSEPVVFDIDFSANNTTTLLQQIFDIIGEAPVIN